MINPTELGIERKKRYDQMLKDMSFDNENKIKRDILRRQLAVDSKSDYQMIDSPFASTSAYKALQTDTALLPIPRPTPKPSGTKTGRKFRVS